MTDLPPNVYRLPQSRFDAIPGSPWVYKIDEPLRELFEKHPSLEIIGKPKQGLVTGNNFRFIRFCWEIGREKIGVGFTDRLSAKNSTYKWFPVVKSSVSKWYSPIMEVVNWAKDGTEIVNFSHPDGRQASRPQNTDKYFLPGAAYSSVSSRGLSFRWIPAGNIYEHASNAIFPEDTKWSAIALVGLFNSVFSDFIVGLSETININIEDLLRTPIVDITGEQLKQLELLVLRCVRIRFNSSLDDERYFSFKYPRGRQLGQMDANVDDYENQINQLVYDFYGISKDQRMFIEKEVSRKAVLISYEIDGTDEDGSENEDIEDGSSLKTDKDDLGIRWISFSVGIVLGRFKPGINGEQGCSIYRREDFTIGSLSLPDEAEYNDLVGPADQFAYIDETGGRHVFSREVEEKLRALADSDGIAVLDQGHPDDLPAKVETALELMLGETGAAEVIAAATGESHDLSKALRRFLERDFFTKHHLKMYRKRPVYWLPQSPQRLYGLYLFHERLTRDTLFVLQRQYVDRKINLTRQQLAEQRIRVEKAATARERRELNRQAEDLERLLLDVEEFARRLKAITDRGYTPHIDDGVILNMSPLWEVIPSWSKEPKKYWEGLENGDYDWAHLAMDYRPAEVREKCRTDKSLAIAHGHEEWFEG